MRALMVRQITAGLAVLVLLSACASPPPVRYYRLDPMNLEPQATTGQPAVLALGPMSFPDYLRRPQLVRRGQGAEMTVDEFHRWAEPLDEAVPRVLAVNVSALADDLVVVPGARRPVTPDYRLIATVHRLDTDASGETVMLVQWSISGRDRAAVVPPRTTRYRSRASPADDPGAMAEATSDLLAQFSRDIAAALEHARRS